MVGYALVFIFIAPKNPQLEGLKAILHQYLDLDVDINGFSFTNIHKIVLRLSPISLSSQLKLSTADIDKGDYMGKTPLMWAVHANNESSGSRFSKQTSKISQPEYFTNEKIALEVYSHS